MILGIETSSLICSVAIYNSTGAVAFELNSTDTNKHSEELPGMVSLAIDWANSNGELQAIAVSKGPGSYTGLRIGVSMAKGLCYSLKLPLISMNAFLGMSKKSTILCPPSDYYISMLDARRNDVYVEVYDSNLNCIQEVSAITIDENTFAQYHSNKVVVCGNSNEKWKQLAGEFQYIQYFDTEPSAAFCGNEVAFKWQAKLFENLAYFEPFYLKDFIPGTPKKAPL